MNGRPERAQTIVRLVRRAQSRESSSRALPLTMTIAIITIFVAALITRANESGTALIGAWDPPVVSVPDGAITWLCRSFSEGDILGAARNIGCAAPDPRRPLQRRRRCPPAGTPTSPPPTRPTTTGSARSSIRRADCQRATYRRTSCPFPGRVCPAAAPFGASRSRISRHSSRPRGRPGSDSRSSRHTGARPASKGRSRVGYAPQEKPRPDVSVRAPDTRSTSSGPPSTSRPRAAGPRGRTAFARSRQARWLADNAWRFGWIQSYPPGAETQTCYGAEAWHYRYVGRDVAAEVHASGMTLRAWLWLHPSAD